MVSDSYRTQGGIAVHRDAETLDFPYDLASIAVTLDGRRGALFSSSYDYPGRYARWDKGFADPPLVLTARERWVAIVALNARGEVLLAPIARLLQDHETVAVLRKQGASVTAELHAPDTRFPEELRSRQPSVFSVLRALIALFAAPQDAHLGLYGAFGYDLVFQFEPMALRLAREEDQRDLVLFLPDELVVVDHARHSARRIRYDFTIEGHTTRGLSRVTVPAPYTPGSGGDASATSDHASGEYASMVDRARAAFARGDLFEVVLGQLLSARCTDAPSTIFQRLRAANPAPYGALINLGEGEFLVSASPEMFVRVQGRRIETCPISGTMRRGADALEDAARIRELLGSAKDEAELTMCTDVDRNDKSRICEAGSVRVIGRRQIELYSRLIHTVDHVEGLLRPAFDALDGFLSHAWAVTVTGAPKPGAIAFIEAEEKSARRWYGGAIGSLTFDGNIDTGLTLRTIRMKEGVAEMRVGATLLHDSDPDAEEAETRLKAAAMFAAIAPPARAKIPAVRAAAPGGHNKRVLLVDHEDSFVHTLAGYFRSAGADVVTLRTPLAQELLRHGEPVHLVVLSPGPRRPSDFAMNRTLDLAVQHALPVFGVCLGLQGMVEYAGGALETLGQPMHGKPSEVEVLGGRLLAGLPRRFLAGRYHSLHARRASLPPVFTVTAETADGVVMGIEHVSLPMAAVQFHPESLMTPVAVGRRLIDNALGMAGCSPRWRRRATATLRHASMPRHTTEPGSNRA
jgi:anthranilate synthase